MDIMDSSPWIGQWVEFENCFERLDVGGKQLLEQSLRTLYNKYEVPIEVRKTLASVIETISSDEAGRSQEELDVEGTVLYDEILQELQKQLKEKAFPVNSALVETTEKFQTKFAGNPILLVRHVRTCLVQEKEVIVTSQNGKLDNDSRRRVYQEKCGKVTGAMNVLQLNILQCDTKLKELCAKTESVVKKYDEVHVFKEKQSKKTGKTPQNKTDHQKKVDRELEARQQELEADTNALNRYRQDSEQRLVNLCEEVLQQIEETWNCIHLYEKEQKFNILDAGMGPPEGALKDLNDMCETVNEVLVQLAQLLTSMTEIHKSFADDVGKTTIQAKIEQFDAMFQKHLERIIVIDGHPNQVMKVSKGRSLKFNMSLRILGPFNLGLHINRPVVTANLHSEKDLAKQLQPNTEVTQGMPMQGASGIEAKYENSTKQLKVNFNPVQISSLKRPSDGRSRDERVTEYKYGMIFSVRIYVDGKENRVKKLSMPIILTTQSSQEWAAKGTLIWDAAFSQDNRHVYEDARIVTWEQLAELINMLFRESTNRALTVDQLAYLAQRLFGGSEHDDFSQCEVTKENFLKEKLDSASFSLWNWIYACLNLIRQSLNKEWEKGLIMGFVSREKAAELMQDCDNGTFLLRFKASEISDSQSAHNTAILAPSAVFGSNGNKQVYHWDLKQAQQSSQKNLARKLMSCQVPSPENPEVKWMAFKTLYPNIPFEEAFGELIQDDEPKKKNEYYTIINKIELRVSDLSLGTRSVPASPASSSFHGGKSPGDSEMFDSDMPDMLTIENDVVDWFSMPDEMMPSAVTVETVEQVPLGENSDQLTALLTCTGILDEDGASYHQL